MFMSSALRSRESDSVPESGHQGSSRLCDGFEAREMWQTMGRYTTDRVPVTEHIHELQTEPKAQEFMMREEKPNVGMAPSYAANGPRALSLNATRACKAIYPNHTAAGTRIVPYKTLSRLPEYGETLLSLYSKHDEKWVKDSKK